MKPDLIEHNVLKKLLKNSYYETDSIYEMNKFEVKSNYTLDLLKNNWYYVIIIIFIIIILFQYRIYLCNKKKQDEEIDLELEIESIKSKKKIYKKYDSSNNDYVNNYYSMFRSN